MPPFTIKSTPGRPLKVEDYRDGWIDFARLDSNGITTCAMMISVEELRATLERLPESTRAALGPGALGAPVESTYGSPDRRFDLHTVRDTFRRMTATKRRAYTIGRYTIAFYPDGKEFLISGTKETYRYQVSDTLRPVRLFHGNALDEAVDAANRWIDLDTSHD